ncbi:hypothetical protein EG327_005643 [Venturia inaequalis]|uniref:Uncharacterized protein n=1 Tax=Venturia inaequalis TaxID=5025 RepID=A0A8H3U106_VENIN|nr:hypothetical protein EG327_005643 [Venturia inaequalis]
MRKPYDLIPTKYISTINNIIEEHGTLDSAAVPAALTLRLADANKQIRAWKTKSERFGSTSKPKSMLHVGIALLKEVGNLRASIEYIVDSYRSVNNQLPLAPLESDGKESEEEVDGV